MQAPALARALIPRLPFYYGWVVLACVCLAGFARQGAAVAVLSVFVAPMTQEFGWSRTAISGAVSVGGILAAITSPVIGPFLDRSGARLVLCLAVAGTGLANVGLSFTGSLLVFYLLFCFARMNWAGPFELGLYGALNNWFIARRRFANSVASLAQLSGLVFLPLIAQFAMQGATWRAGWVAIGLTVLLVGFLPCWLLLVRRPEDVGLTPDHAPATTGPATPEPHFTRAQALRSTAFWLLALYTVLVFPVQAGVSLHQAPHLIERGLTPLAAASVISFFSVMSALASIAVGLVPRRIPVRVIMAACAALAAIGAYALTLIATPLQASIAAGIFGLGIGGVLTVLPLAWAEYFGRQSYGAIRGVALSLQILAQASGPVVSGLLRDISGTYTLSLTVATALAATATLIALAATPPRSASSPPPSAA